VSVRSKLVLASVPSIGIVLLLFTMLELNRTRHWLEEDLKERALVFTREIAATIGERRELEHGALLDMKLRKVRDVRPSVVQLEVLAFEGETSRVVATTRPEVRLPFVREDAQRVAAGQVVARLIEEEGRRSWEIMAPIVLDTAVAGAVTARFSSVRVDRLLARFQSWNLGIAGATLVVLAVLLSIVVRVFVDRPVRQFMGAVAQIRAGETTVPVSIRTRDEFGALAELFNEMMTRINRFNDELQARVREATAELNQRYAEVQRLNALLVQLQRSLSHAERLALSGQMMAEVAHEVGTPLHSVAGHLELLRKDLAAGTAPAEIDRRVAIIESQVARVIEIVSTLLDLTRRRQGAAAPVDVARLVEDVAALVRPAAAAAKVALDVRVEQGAVVQGHEDQLQQAVLNLLTNAIDATPPGGLVEAVVRALPDRGEVEAVVRDTGHGIAPEHRARIFEPFFSTKEAGRGTGLGLFIAAQVVRDHHGRLEVDSERGRGSTFRLLLQAATKA